MSENKLNDALYELATMESGKVEVVKVLPILKALYAEVIKTKYARDEAVAELTIRDRWKLDLDSHAIQMDGEDEDVKEKVEENNDARVETYCSIFGENP